MATRFAAEGADLCDPEAELLSLPRDELARLFRDDGIHLTAEGIGFGVQYVASHDSVYKAVAEGFFPGEPGLGLRRVELHRALVDRAEAVGVDLRWGTKVTGLGSGWSRNARR